MAKIREARQGADADPVLVWANEAFASSGKSQAAFAKDAGIDAGSVSRMLKGERKMSVPELRALVRFLEMPLPPQLLNQGRLVRNPDADEIIGNIVPVIGTAATGIWADDAILSRQKSIMSIRVPQDERFANAKCYAMQVGDTSFSKNIQPGHYAICVDYFAARQSLQDNDVVLVETIRAGLTEKTVRRLKRMNGGVWELQPDSWDEVSWPSVRFFEHTAKDIDNADTEIKIKGLVIGSYGRF